VLEGEAAKGFSDHGSNFDAAGSRRIDPEFISWFLFAPPLCGLPSSNPKQIGARRTAFGVEAVRAMPDLGEGFLHNVFNLLFVGKKVPEEDPQARSGFSIPRIECVGVAVGDLLPELPVVEQLDLLPVLRKNGQKSSEYATNLSQVGTLVQQVSPLKILRRLFPGKAVIRPNDGQDSLFLSIPPLKALAPPARSGFFNVRSRPITPSTSPSRIKTLS